MKEILLSNGFEYARHATSPCCNFDIYHKTVNNQLCEVWNGTNKAKFKIVYQAQTRWHINNKIAPLPGQLQAELEQHGLLNQVAL